MWWIFSRNVEGLYTVSVNTLSLFQRCLASFRQLHVESLTLRLHSTRLVAWRTGNAFHPINEVTLRRAGLVLEWVTAYGQVNHLGI